MAFALAWTNYIDAVKEIKDDPREFGTLLGWKGVRVHKMADHIAVSYGGHRVGEIWPDNSHFIVVPNRYTAAVSTRWQTFIGCYVYGRRLKKSNGLVSYKLTARLNDRCDSIEIGSAIGFSRFQILPDGTVLAKDINSLVALTDKAKYKMFCSEMKKLKAILTTKVRMDAMKQYTNNDKVVEELNRLYLTKKGGQWHFHRDFGNSRLDAAIMDWITTHDSQHLHKIIMGSFMRHRSTEQGNEDLRRRVINALAAAQVRFLRKECVTITESDTPKKDSDDQNSQLLQNDGLRKVQVPCEAQVC